MSAAPPTTVGPPALTPARSWPPSLATVAVPTTLPSPRLAPVPPPGSGNLYLPVPNRLRPISPVTAALAHSQPSTSLAASPPLAAPPPTPSIAPVLAASRSANQPGPPFKRQRLIEEAHSDTLSKYISRDAHHVLEHGFASLVAARRSTSDFGPLALRATRRHPACRLLRHYRARGAPVVLASRPWTPERLQQALRRGPHKSALENLDFLRDEMAAMVAKGHWVVLPFSAAKTLPNLRLSPIGVVPQHNRRSRTIVDYSFSGLNQDTQPIAPLEAMQFGRTLDRVLRQILTANPTFGPVHLIKVDLADGFYRVDVRVDDIPKLGVVFPSAASDPLVALPLVLPMGWQNSPPLFCSATETIADVANRRLLQHHQPPGHRLEHVADTPPEPLSLPVASRSTLPPSVPVPDRPDPHLALARRRAKAWVDVYMDDFIGVAQGTPKHLAWVRRVLFDSIDDIFRPLQPGDLAERQEPISVKKLAQGDAAWATSKTVLGWLLDTQSQTITLPPRRHQRLLDLLDSYPRRRSKIPFTEWRKTLGELRSMSLALPGARGLFSLLQQALSHPTADQRVRLTACIHDILDDLRHILAALQDRPTRIAELVPLPPTLLGAHDAAGHGAGGVWFPTPSAHPRAIRLRGQPSADSAPGASPVVWRLPFPKHIQQQLVSFANPSGAISNSDLELAGAFLHLDCAAQCYDIRERTVKAATDNTPTLFWSRKGSVSTTGPAAPLLRLMALHQRHHRYVKLHDFIPGVQNRMADDASRLQHLSNSEFLTYFNSTYPQTRSWRLWTPPPGLVSSTIGALLRQRSPPELFLNAPAPPIPTGPSGLTSAPRWPSIPFSPTLKTPLSSSKYSSTATELEPLPPVASLSSLGPWKMPYGVLAKRSLSWGPRIPASRTKAAWTSASNVSLQPTKRKTRLPNASSLSPSKSSTGSWRQL